MIELRPRRFAAFLRNVMVGRLGLSSEVLTRELEGAGGQTPRNFLATGNLTFTALPDQIQAISQRLEDSIESVIGRREEVFVQSVEHLAEMVTSDPFRSVMEDDVNERCVSFVDKRDPSALKLPLETPNADALIFASGPHEVLSITRLVRGRPGKPGQLVESLLNCRVTTRNWNTIERIVRLEALDASPNVAR